MKTLHVVLTDAQIMLLESILVQAKASAAVCGDEHQFVLEKNPELGTDAWEAVTKLKTLITTHTH